MSANCIQFHDSFESSDIKLTDNKVCIVTDRVY